MRLQAKGTREVEKVVEFELEQRGTEVWLREASSGYCIIGLRPVDDIMIEVFRFSAVDAEHYYTDEDGRVEVVDE